jgi:hypothetical protein
MRIEREDHLWLHVLDDPPNGGLDFEHVHVGEGPRIAVPLAFATRRVVEAEEQRFFDAEAIAGQPQLFDA